MLVYVFHFQLKQSLYEFVWLEHLGTQGFLLDWLEESFWAQKTFLNPVGNPKVFLKV